MKNIKSKITVRKALYFITVLLVFFQLPFTISFMGKQHAKKNEQKEFAALLKSNNINFSDSGYADAYEQWRKHIDFEYVLRDRNTGDLYTIDTPNNLDIKSGIYTNGDKAIMIKERSITFCNLTKEKIVHQEFNLVDYRMGKEGVTFIYQTETGMVFQCNNDQIIIQNNDWSGTYKYTSKGGH